MKRTRRPAEQIIRKLKTAEQLAAQGKTVADVCRVIKVVQLTSPTRGRLAKWCQSLGSAPVADGRPGTSAAIRSGVVVIHG
jgi:hypothetical protein